MLKRLCRTFLLLTTLFTFTYNGSEAQVNISLYQDSIPNSLGTISKENIPEMKIYLAPRESGKNTAVIIFPGGAYSFLAYEEEGTKIAKAFLEKGISAFVVKYRLPNDKDMRDKSLAPLQDAQQAIKVVRMRAAEWGIDADRIGVVGFSAGGHVASTLGTHFSVSYIPNKENIKLRPDFMILVYPVISMDNSLTHRGSRISLLGEGPSMEKVLFFCNEERVTGDVPPTYLTHTGDDDIVSVNNSIAFYQALQNAKVDAELLLTPRGNHGFIQRLPTGEWLDPMLHFLKKEGFLKDKM